MERRIIKPSILVGLKSTISGGIKYDRVDLERARIDNNGTEMAKWETTRLIDNKDEYDEAVKVRGKAVSNIRRLCHAFDLGLVCPMEKVEELETAIRESKEIVREFNRDSIYSKINIFPSTWEARDNGEDAVRQLSAEVMELIEEMQTGINSFNVAGIRKAANKARQLAGVWEREPEDMLNDAIKQARKAARMFVKRVEKEGEQAEAVLAEVKRNDLEKARVAFLDYSQEEEDKDADKSLQSPQRFADLDVSEEIKEIIEDGNEIGVNITPDTNIDEAAEQIATISRFSEEQIKSRLRGMFDEEEVKDAV